MQYNFHFRNKYAVNGTMLALQKLTAKAERAPVIVCIGTDLISGDSLGPVAGSMILKKTGKKGLILFGSLDCTVTAREIKYLNYFLKATFKDRMIVTIDAAVGRSDEVGLIKISDIPLRPGSGINKKLGEVGNVNIQGVVAEKTPLLERTLKEVRMNMVYKMADVISDSISDYIYNMC